MKAFAAISVVLSVMLFSPASLARVEMAKVGEFQVAYEQAGSGAVTVLLEAGGSAGIDDWEPIFESLSRHARVIRYARVGNGRSTPIKRHFASEEYAGHTLALLKALEVKEPVVLVAHSYGGLVARAFAAAYPDSVQALLLIDPSSEHDVDIMRAIDLPRANREIAQIKRDDMANGMSNSYLDFWSKRPMPDYPEIGDIPVTVIASVKHYPEPANLFFTDEAREAWGRLHKQWAEQFPRGRAVLTDKSYHYIQFDEPQLVIDEIRSLLARLPQR